MDTQAGESSCLSSARRVSQENEQFQFETSLLNEKCSHSSSLQITCLQKRSQKLKQYSASLSTEYRELLMVKMNSLYSLSRCL